MWGTISEGPVREEASVDEYSGQFYNSTFYVSSLEVISPQSKKRRVVHI